MDESGLVCCRGVGEGEPLSTVRSWACVGCGAGPKAALPRLGVSWYDLRKGLG